MSESSVATTKRNGDLEFLRIVFCLYVILFHFNKYIIQPPKTDEILLRFFPHGALGVEFFFICSGFLMARSIHKELEKKTPAGSAVSIGESTISFIWRKIKAFLSQHIIAFLPTAIVYAVMEGYTIKQTLWFFVDSIPSFFLLQMSGFSMRMPNGVEWYISAMLIVMLILYPIMKKHYSFFVTSVAPVVGLLICGYLYQKYGSITGVKTWDGFVFKSLLRALACICFGVFTYEFVRRREALAWTVKRRVIDTVLFAGCLILSLLLVLFSVNRVYGFYMIPIAMVLIGIGYTGKTYFSKLFSNKVVFFLGRFSLSVYLGQIAAINLSIILFPDERLRFRLLAAFVLTVVWASVIYFLGKQLDKVLFKKRKANA